MASQWPIVWNARWIWAADSVRRERQMVAESVPPHDSWNRFCYSADPTWSSATLAQAIVQRFTVSLHRRTIERARRR